MYYCIVILTSVAILHFVYESIIAPSLRLELRYELFKLNDEVNSRKFEWAASEGAEFMENHFCELQDSINSLACMLFRFDLLTLCEISEGIDHDAELKRRVEARSRILDTDVSPEVRSIRSKQIRIATKALAVNSGPLLIWLALPALAFVGYKAVRDKIKNSLTVPGTDLNRFLPEESRMKVGLPA